MKTKNTKLFKYRLRAIWESDYYGSVPEKNIRREFLNNPFLIKLLKYSIGFKSIFDAGCGEGRILEVLWRKHATFYGVDISKSAITKAKKRFRTKQNVNFKVHDIENKLTDIKKYDLVYSVYVLEHVDSPEKVISNISEKLNKNGLLILVCPNFGSPFQPSGNKLINGESGIQRAILNFLKSHVYLFTQPSHLFWNSVYPKVLDSQKWMPDFDATNEPNIQTLIYFLKQNGFKVTEYSSGLELSQKFPIKNGLSLLRWFFEYLGRHSIPPYKYWGPTAFVVAKKL